MTKRQDDNVQHSLLKYTIHRWQNILTRMKKNPSQAAVRSSNKRYECNRCTNKFVHLSGLERHKAKFHADDVDASSPEKVPYFAMVIKCVCCGAVFPNVDQFVDHSIRFHSELLSSSYLSGGDDRANAVLCSLMCTVVIGSAYMCEFCDTRFSDKPSLFHHESLHDPADGFSCDQCQLNVPTIEEILAHRVNKPEAFRQQYDGGIPNVTNVYCCNVCENVLYTLPELHIHRHEMNHFFPRQTERQLQLLGHCVVCGYLSNRATELAEHYSEKHAKRASTMNKTTPSLRRKSVINQEQRTKLARPYLCEKCGKT